MQNPLEITAIVDVSQLDKLARISFEVAKGTDSMSEAFVKGSSAASRMAVQFSATGLTVQETASALKNLGFTAKETAEGLVSAGLGAVTLGKESAAAATGVDSMTRALASGGVRIASSELGLGQLGFSLARVAGSSAMLSNALQFAFAPLSATALIGQVVRL